MKPPRQNVGKAGTKGTKPLPDGVGIAVRPFPVQLFTVRPFPKKAVTSPESFHDLGEILTPEQMAAKVPPRASPEAIARAARQALDALAGCGPRQPVPHVYTAEAVSRGLAALRDFALAGDLDAMRSLGFVLSQAVADLGEMARKKPEVVREWSRKQNVAPVLTGKNKGHPTQLAADLDAFGVGEATPYRVNLERRKGNPGLSVSTPANALAGLLAQHLAAHRPPGFNVRYCRPPVPDWVKLASALPELSRETAVKWAEAAFEMLKSSFENDAELVKCCDLGDVREGETTNGVSPQISAIKTRLRRAFRGLTPES